MKITYLEHSGFLVETDECAIIFDYFKGGIPALPAGVSLYVLASHAHHDHFNPAIFRLKDQYPQTTYILSDDISGHEQPWVHKTAPDQSVQFPHFSLRTTGSTDQGVSFLLSLHSGETLYHAGDLNWWTWIGEETEEEALSMEKRFKKEVAKLESAAIDAAFLPLDPRQQERYCWGFDYYMRQLNIANAFPMHFWGDPTVIGRLKTAECSEPYRSRIRDLHNSGESCTV